MSIGLELLIAALCGGFVGLLSGTLGVGGGIIMVPLFLFLFQLQGLSLEIASHLAVGTSLGIIVFSSASASYWHRKLGFLKPAIVFKMALPALVGIYLAGWLRNQFDVKIFLGLFSLFLFVMAYKLIKKPRIKESDAPGSAELSQRFPKTLSFSITGFVSGFIASLFGVGGGIITVPLLHFFLKMKIREAIGISAGMILFASFFASLTNLYFGLRNPEVKALALPGTYGYLRWSWILVASPMSILSAYGGARLAKYLPVRSLKVALGVLALLAGLRILWNVYGAGQ